MTHSFPTRRSSDLFVGSALADDVALVALDEGYEGRVWRRNVLVASIWWPDLPSLAQWNGFLRGAGRTPMDRSEEHTSELQSLMRISYAVFCLKKKKQNCSNSIQHDHKNKNN